MTETQQKRTNRSKTFDSGYENSGYDTETLQRQRGGTSKLYSQRTRRWGVSYLGGTFRGLDSDGWEERIDSILSQDFNKGLNGGDPIWCIHRTSFPVGEDGKRKRVDRKCLVMRMELFRVLDRFKDVRAGLWYRARFAGDWVISDDGLVARVLRIWRPGRTGADPRKTTLIRKEIVLPYGRRWVSYRKGSPRRPKDPLFAFARMRAGCWHSLSPMTMTQWQLKRPEYVAGAALFIELWIRRAGLLTDEDCHRVVRTFFPHRSKEKGIKFARLYLRRVFNLNIELRQHVMALLKEEMDRQGLSLGEGLNMLKKAFDVAEQTGNAKEMRHVGEYIVKKHSEAAVDMQDKIGGGTVSLEEIYAQRKITTGGEVIDIKEITKAHHPKELTS